jgi:hypothetical protein
MSTGKHNQTEFNAFIELRNLIDAKPNDIKLLKTELAENYYQQRLTSMSSLRSHLDDTFEANFFGRSTRSFFGTTKYKFSKRHLTVTCVNDGNREVIYDIIWERDDLSLRVA